MRFEFATAARIIFGEGSMQEVAPAASSLGKKCMLITGRSIGRSDYLLEQLRSQGLSCVTYQIPGEPTTQMVLEGTAYGRSEHCDMVIGFGGGSVLDTGKAVSALLSNSGDLFDYLEVIGRGKSITLPPVPYIAVPTTAGTGSEVTKNAVIISEAYGVKVSMRSPLMLPRLVVVDPEVTYSLQPDVTASTGLDAFTQLLESYVTRGANPMTDGICREGLTRASRSLRIVYKNGSNKDARMDMALSSLLSGLTLANAGLGAVHGFAAAIGGEFYIPHGLICACLLPFVTAMNVGALKSRASVSTSLARYDEIAKILTGNSEAMADDAVSWIHGLCTELEVPSLSGMGITREDFAGIVAKAMRASSMKGNPIELAEDELTEILEKAYG
jgi:alcohol dehydrogenase class IV